MRIINGQTFLTAGDIGEIFGITRIRVLSWSWDGGLPRPDISEPGYWLWRADPFTAAGLCDGC
jgi:hypothetical protein